MDKDNLPDLSLERDILNKMKLSKAQRMGAEKFLEAIKGVTNINSIGIDNETEFLNLKRSKLDNPQLQAMISCLTEFLSSFIVVGYDLSGSRVQLYNFPNQLSIDGCISNLKDSLISCSQLSEQYEYDDYEDEQ